jgi:hypothetical protein
MGKVKTKAFLKLLDEKMLVQRKVGERIGYSGDKGAVYFNRIIHNTGGATFDPSKTNDLADALGEPVDTIIYLFGLAKEPAEVK